MHICAVCTHKRTRGHWRSVCADVLIVTCDQNDDDMTNVPSVGDDKSATLPGTYSARNCVCIGLINSTMSVVLANTQSVCVCAGMRHSMYQTCACVNKSLRSANSSKCECDQMQCTQRRPDA